MIYQPIIANAAFITFGVCGWTLSSCRKMIFESFTEVYMWKKINMNQSFWISRHTCHDLDICLESFGWWTPFVMQLHAELFWIWREVVNPSIVTLELWFPPIQTHAYVCTSWSNIHIFWVHWAHISLNNILIDNCLITFKTYAIVGCNVMQFSSPHKINSSAWWLFILCAAFGCMWACSRFETSTWHS